MASATTPDEELETVADRDMQELLSTIVPKMDWSRQREDVVMHVGCGNRKSTHAIIERYPDFRKIVAIDRSDKYFKNMQGPFGKIYPYQVDIEKAKDLGRWTGSMTKIISTKFLGYVAPEKIAFKNIYDLLKPGGEAALLNITKCGTWEAFAALLNKPEWVEFKTKDATTAIPETQSLPFLPEWFERIARSVGFEVVICEEGKGEVFYADEEECKESLLSICKEKDFIPKNLRSKFESDLCSEFKRFKVLTSEGTLKMFYSTIKLLLRKPQPQKR